MNNTNTGLSWFYYNPFFGHDKIAADGNTGIVESGVNLALWGTLAGFVAHFAGAKKPIHWGLGVFAGLAVMDFFFNTSNSFPNTSFFGTFQGGTASGPAVTGTINTPSGPASVGTLGQGGFNESEEGGYGQTA